MPARTSPRRAVRRLVVVAAVIWAKVVLAMCGDGVVDPGEACDDGNLVPGDCCSPTCTPEAAGGPCADDGNPCSEDRCDTSGTCTHPAGGEAPCDDGDPCTTADACGDGVCAGTPVPEQCVDAVLCHHASRTNRFAPVPVGVDDQSNLLFGDVRGPRDLCFPATTAGGALNDAATSLVNLAMDVDARLPPGTWHVTDRFGSYDVVTSRPDRLLVAARSSSVGPPAGPPAPGSANHYACRTLDVPRSPDVPGKVRTTVEDALGSHPLALLRPHRLCSPADVDAPGTGMAHPRAHLMCYRVRHLRSGTSEVEIHTASQLGTDALHVRRGRDLCVPAVAEQAASACLTDGDECGLPCCRIYPGQHADCTFAPVLTPRYRGCAGPTILVDRTHVNFHDVTPESPRNPGRFWGFAKLLVRDGYVVRDSTVPFAALLPTTSAKIVVVANPRTLSGPDAVSPADVAALVGWVENGGSLLLSIDHPPFEEVGALLAALGIDRSGITARRYTFTRASGDLNGASIIANGTDPSSAIDEVTTFTGTAFSISPTPPAQARYEAVLTYPLQAPGHADGLLQGVTIELGAGRVYLSGESGGLTAQDRFGMQFTPENQQYVLNIIHWLDR